MRTPFVFSARPNDALLREHDQLLMVLGGKQAAAVALEIKNDERHAGRKNLHEEVEQ